MAKTKNSPPNTIVVKISEVKPNAQNPRTIKDEKFEKLVQSIKSFPEMLQLRPVVVNGDRVILGGNMRYQAAKAAGMKEIPILEALNLTPEQEREFIIKDNVSGGDWDYDVLANEWDVEELNDWGLDLWQPEDVNLEEFFEEEKKEGVTKEGKHLIVFDFEDEEAYEKVKSELNSREGKKEEILVKLLGL